MGETCRVYESQDMYKTSACKSEVMKQLGRLKSREESNIKTDLKELGDNITEFSS